MLSRWLKGVVVRSRGRVAAPSPRFSAATDAKAAAELARRRRRPRGRRGGSAAPSRAGRGLSGTCPARGKKQPRVRLPAARLEPWRSSAGGCALRAAVVPGPRPRGLLSLLFCQPIDEAFRVASERAPGGPALPGLSVMGKPRRCPVLWQGGLLSNSLPVAGEVSPLPLPGGRLYRPGLCDGRVAPRALRCPSNHARSLVLAPARVVPVGAGREQRLGGGAARAFEPEKGERDPERKGGKGKTPAGARSGEKSPPRARAPHGARSPRRRLLQSEPPRPRGLGVRAAPASSGRCLL